MYVCIYIYIYIYELTMRLAYLLALVDGCDLRLGDCERLGDRVLTEARLRQEGGVASCICICTYMYTYLYTHTCIYI